jgi:hypothetical protein
MIADLKKSLPKCAILRRAQRWAHWPYTCTLRLYAVTVCTIKLVENWINMHCLFFLTDDQLVFFIPAVDPNVKDRYDVTPLHLASETGHVSCLKRLLDARADRNPRTRSMKDSQSRSHPGNWFEHLFSIQFCYFRMKTDHLCTSFCFHRFLYLTKD